MATVSVLVFCDLLRRYRLAAGLTQRALALRAGLSVRSVGELERDARRSPQRATIGRLAQALALSPADRALLERAAGRRAVSPHAAAPARAAPARRPLPALVGRAAELASIERHLAGEGAPVLLLAGEPGIGKTRLLQEVVVRAEAAGWRTLEGGCHRRSGQEPYAPFVEALARAVEQQPSARRATDLAGCSWLARLLPELTALPGFAPPTWALPPAQERRLMFAAVERFLMNSAGSVGTLLVLDDLHWAGPDALDLLSALAHATARVPLRIIAAYRDTEVRQGEALADLLADLARADLAESRTLAPLTLPEAAHLLATLLTDAPPSPPPAPISPARDGQRERVRQVLQRAGGVPFFLVSCVQELHAGAPAVRPTSAASAGAVPWSVAESIRQRLAPLPAAAQALIGVAAVVGRAAPGALLGAVAALSERETLAALDVLSRARLLVETREGAYAITHDLIREVVRADLSAARRALLHRHVAEAIERAATSAGDEPPVEVLAYHYRRGGQAEKALIYLEQAGARAQAMHAHGEAIHYYRELVALLDGLARRGDAAQAREHLGLALMTAGHYDAALAVLDEARQTYRALADVAGEGRAAARIGGVHVLRGTPELGVEQLAPLFGVLQAAGLAAHGLAEIALVLSQQFKNSGRYGEQLAAAEQATTLARQAHDDRLIGQAEIYRGTALLTLGRLSEGVAIVQAAIPHIEARGDLPLLAQAYNSLAVTYVTWGDFARDLEYMERAVAVAEEVGDPTLLAFMVHRRGINAFYRGEWGVARADCERSAAITREIGSSSATVYALIALGRLALAEGRWNEAGTCLTEAVERATDSRDMQSLRWAQSALTERSLLLGEAEAARAHLEPLLDLTPGRRQERDAMQLLPLLAWAYLALGHPDRAEAVLTPTISQGRAEGYHLELLDALRVQGLLAGRLGQWEQAHAALEEALTLARSMPYPYAEAKALYFSGLLHREAGEPELARARLEEALALCTRLGERLYAAQIEQALAGY